MKKYFLLSIVFASVCACLQAQEFKKTLSVSDQLRNNSVAGLKYGTANAQKQAGSKDHPTMAESLKKGLVPGVKFAPGTGSTVENNKVAKTTNGNQQQAELASSTVAVKPEAARQIAVPVVTAQGDITYEQADAQSKKQTATTAKIAPVPTQEEKPKEEKKDQ